VWKSDILPAFLTLLQTTIEKGETSRRSGVGLQLVRHVAGSMMGLLYTVGLFDEHHTCSTGTGDIDKAIVDALKEFLDSLDTGGRRTIDEQRAVRIFLAIATETGLPKAAVQRRLGVTWNKSFASASLAGDAAASSSSGLSELLAGPVRKTRCDQVPPLRTLSLPPWEAIPGAPMLCQARVL